MPDASLRATVPLLPESELQRRWAATLRSLPDPNDATLLRRSFRPSGAMSAPELAPPRAPFSIYEELGRGGMGVVYRARQESLQREVALKTILGEADLRAREAFLAEARVTGWLEHPNIVPVYDLDYAPDSGQPFLSMKVVRGLSWKDLLYPQTAEQRAKAERRERPRDDLEILKAVCNALAYAHDRGVAHLDLKPENVMVGDYGEVLLMDWGTALDIREAPLGETRARHKSELASPCGTPVYMAPELANGEGQRCGPWTDIYLLGAVLYELLTGRPPHQGRGLMQVIFTAARGEPPSFSAEEVASLPEELRRLCLKAMAREPGDRFGSVAAFRQALEDFLEHQESITLCVGAEAALDQAEARLAERRIWTPDRLAELTSELAEAAAGFRQARSLWRENPRAREGARAAQALYVRTALDNGDLNTARAQARLLEDGPESRELHRAISQAEQGREARQDRKSRRARSSLFLAAAAMLLSVILGGLISALRSSAESEREQAARRYQDLESRRRELEEDIQRLTGQQTKLEAENKLLRSSLALRERSSASGARTGSVKPPSPIALVRAQLLTADPRVDEALELELKLANRSEAAYRLGSGQRRTRPGPLGWLTVTITRRDGLPFRTRDGRAGLQKSFRLLRQSLVQRREAWSLRPGEQVSDRITLSTRGLTPGDYRLRFVFTTKSRESSRLELDLRLR